MLYPSMTPSRFVSDLSVIWDFATSQSLLRVQATRRESSPATASRNWRHIISGRDGIRFRILSIKNKEQTGRKYGTERRYRQDFRWKTIWSE